MESGNVTLKPARCACRRLTQPAVGPRKRNTARGTTQPRSPEWAIADGLTNTHRKDDKQENTVKTAHPVWRQLQNTSGWPHQGVHSPRLRNNPISRRGGRSRSGLHPSAEWRASLLKSAPPPKKTGEWKRGEWEVKQQTGMGKGEKEPSEKGMEKGVAEVRRCRHSVCTSATVVVGGGDRA